MSLHQRSTITTPNVLCVVSVLAFVNCWGASLEAQTDRLFTTRGEAVKVPLTTEDGVFHFAIYGDRTGGVPAGLKVLEQAVVDTNLLDPDLVMTVGDLVQGYNRSEEWLFQMREFQEIMNRLSMPWFPVAGNHDVYWRPSDADKPIGQHEANYEMHFGPLWYSFSHKNAGFVVLYSDEGNRESNEKGFNEGRLQQMSPEQLDFLSQSLERLKGKDHVFVFLHHPRWIGGNYEGTNWDEVHARLVEAGNVSAVFAGHIHQMRYDGNRDGIKYYALATTGGALSAEIPQAGLLHHMNIVTVREESFRVATIPVGAVINPERFTSEFLREVGLARRIAPEFSKPIEINVDGSMSTEFEVTVTNPTAQPIDFTITPTVQGDAWIFQPDHQHGNLASGESQTLSIQTRRMDDSLENLEIPELELNVDLLGEGFRVDLPARRVGVESTITGLSPEFFDSSSNLVLDLQNPNLAEPSNAVQVNMPAGFLPQGAFTVEVWVNPRKLDGSRGIVAKTESSEFALFAHDGKPQFDVRLEIPSGGSRYVTALAEEQLALNEWTHLAGVYTGQEVQLFVNGKLSAEAKGSGQRRVNELSFYVGADPNFANAPTRGVDGKLDEFRLSKGIRYASDFEPSKRHSRDSDTLLLLHFDRQIGPYHPSDSATEILPRSMRQTGAGLQLSPAQ